MDFSIRNPQSAIRNSSQGACWPTPQQELLVKAVLWQGRDAVVAWEAWHDGLDLDHLDAGSYQLLPLLYRNLRAQDIDHPLMQRFKGIYRHTWYKNQLLFHRLAGLLRAFHAAEIETMVLKGAALILLYYRDYGLRPMEDFDVLVPTAQASAAVTVLGALRWTPIRAFPATLTEAYQSAIHAHGFRDPGGYECDLHWHALLDCCQPHADDDFWSGAISTRLDDVPVSVLNPADQLLHVCVHGARWSGTPPLRWIVDAMVIVNDSPGLDWNRLVAQAQQHRLSLPIRDMLSYLHERLDAPIPPSVLHALRQAPVSNAEQMEYQAKTGPEDLRKPMSMLRLRYQQYVESIGRDGFYNKLIGFPQFLQHLWGVDHLWQVPWTAVMKGIQRVRRIWENRTVGSGR
ncbi:MAG: nucleotidyltransferase family protein [Candidatus Latescibacteria bacterium]|nr:nucleotidyltransferase family protein [Candidatus Latescibacterota bacterium]